MQQEQREGVKIKVEEEAIKKIVMETVQEIKKQKMLTDWKTTAYKDMSERLFKFYRSKENNDQELKKAIMGITYDPYFKIITLFYRDELTIEYIAREMNVEDSTVVRNKKRLALQLCLLCGW